MAGEGQAHLDPHLPAPAPPHPCSPAPSPPLPAPLFPASQGGTPLYGRQPRSGLWTTFVSFLWFSLAISALTFMWGVGAAAVRKYAAGGGLPAPGGPPGTAVNGANSLFAPKEYNKVRGCVLPFRF